MGDEFDVEAMLEAPYQKEDHSSAPVENGVFGKEKDKNRNRDKDKEKDKDRDRDRDRDRVRGRDRDRDRDRDQDRDRDRVRVRDRDKDKDRDRDRKKERDRDRDKDRNKDKDRDKDREDKDRKKSSSDKKKKKSRSRSQSQSRDRDRKRRSKSHEKKKRSKSRSRSKDRKQKKRSSSHSRRSRSHSRDRKNPRGHRTRSRSPIRAYTPPNWTRRRDRKSISPFRSSWSDGYKIDPKTGVMSLANIRYGSDNLTPEERDARTVFCMQLAARVRPRDLEEFFSSVGKVRDVKLITDTKTRRSKGIAYVEFVDIESVPLALGLSGQKLLGVPIQVQPTQAEKNRAAMNASAQANVSKQIGPMKLYVGSLHFNITEAMLKGIFEPFGKIDAIQLIMDPETGRSKGYGFVTYHNAEDAKKALEQLNGFELAGRAMKVGHVTERGEGGGGASFLDNDELDRAGIDLGATGRLQLMAKLAEGTGLELPAAATSALNMTASGLIGNGTSAMPAPPIATQCFMLSNMFDPTSETRPGWDAEIRDEIIEECNKHGGVFHIYVDQLSPQGNVYVKCPTIASAASCVNALHGRWFAGRIITAAYVPLINYHNLFPDSLSANQLIMASRGN